eukprot:TRINITY_DN781933_c0_g1_i1.p1 TRINITY_DN781933_c0_g1~~TRINITY_DN781933_c0_g1_i1.p1  ORF type:complete len:117 (+),score=22.06 TRINITY_DN781933_c0_g1_i1:136-486(+)
MQHYDKLREGVVQLRDTTIARHPLEKKQNDDSVKEAEKIDRLQMQFGLHAVMEHKFNKKVFSESKRLPLVGKSTSEMGVLDGSDYTIDFKDVFQRDEHPHQDRYTVHELMEKRLNM